MRLKIRFYSDRTVVLPLHYNYIVQGFIYSHLSPYIKHLVHEVGVPYKKRTYKLFTFSMLFARKLEINGKTVRMTPPIDLYVSAYNDNILESFAITLVKQGEVKLGNNTVSVGGIMVIVPPEYSDELAIRAISPITIYSTFITEGRKYVHYYSPFEEEFSVKLRKNLKRKYYAVFGGEPNEKDDFLEIIPVKVPETPSIIYYKEHIIKGWKGIFKLKTSRIYFHLAYLTGLGSRNSQGFGMWKPLVSTRENGET